MLVSKILVYLYKFQNNKSRKVIHKILEKMEKGEMYSISLRKIMKVYFNIEIGKYTYGGCFNPLLFERSVSIGNYTSISASTRALTRNHPVTKVSTHPFFYNKYLGFVNSDLVERSPLEIGHDVWLGHNVVIVPRVKKIGNGAIIGAGTIITRDVPAYSIVVGNPGKIIKYRFNDDIIIKLEESRWWEKDIGSYEQKLHIFDKILSNINLQVASEVIDQL